MSMTEQEIRELNEEELEQKVWEVLDNWSIDELKQFVVESLNYENKIQWILESEEDENE